ncbi:tRNA 4-thiouridine(8) synthase ThiI [Paenibacillus motobuensis]|uniref:tRNA uracil 4-sulfurtransferase ThiI n=1 Tax=Paenibacillus TaxID=44249 RepID=UPI0020419AF0|nr:MULTISPECIES: tRNA uracil 4-sulfurtransferase ThiI [Paenibacillus]MCM3040495.1 tRNA 4-thiouridine(8) synthase ThiI [Paenibacillus lutimineralis]MCM3647599.1 tRNA 4-thiouridine(8) synthase ThiI [Paenibacillus motobuensis]
MDYEMLLLRFGEITVKGKNRSRFEKAALSHVKSLLRAFPGTEAIHEYGRIYVRLNGQAADPVISSLKNIFGLTSISPVKVSPSKLEDIVEIAVDFVKSIPADKYKTFKVHGRRVFKGFPHSSQELNHLVGGPVLSACPHLKVDVHHPDLELRVEVRERVTYLFCEVIPAAGGFPLGTNGKAMMLLSGGIDSPVAGYSAMRRGLEIECVHFHSYPYTSKKAEEKVLELAQVLSGFSGRIKVHLVPFTDIQTSLAKTGQDNLIITLMRRSMLRIATKLAEKNGALALVTGDSLGQVASQTLASMNVIGKVTDLPLLRPLVMMDKEDIISMAKRIGTYDISILPYEDCCTLFVPKSPATNPNLRIVEHVEKELADLDHMIEAAVENTESVIVKPHVIIRKNQKDEPEVVQEQWF